MPNLPKQPRPTNAQAIRQAWGKEHAAARRARASSDRDAEWDHLERAHVLSQPLATAHVRTHLAMLTFGVRHRDRREIAGQLVRLIVAGPGSALGRYPLGNTGGANVSAVAPMSIPVDLKAMLEDTTATHRALSRGVALGVAQAAVAFAFWWLEELHALHSLEAERADRIIPVWVDVSASDVREQSPMLAARSAVRSGEGREMADLAFEVREAICS